MNRCLYQIPYPYFFSQHNGVGGHIAHALGVVEGFVNKGIDVTVLAHEGKERFKALGANFVDVNTQKKGFINRQFWLKSFFKKRKKLLQEKNFDFTYMRYSISATPWIINRFRPNDSCKEILEVNSFGAQRLPLLKYVDRKVLSSFDKTVVVSQDLVTFAESNLNADNIHLVKNAVSSSRFRPPKKRDSIKTYNIAFAGLLKPDYGLEYVIEAAKLAQGSEYPFHFNFFGDGPIETDLQNKAKECANVSFHGVIDFEKVPDVLSEVDILLYSTDRENSFQSPIKLFEYMAVAVPIVSAKTRQTIDLLSFQNENQFYEIGDPAGMNKALMYTVENYDDSIKVAKQGQKIAQNTHSWDTRIEEIISDL